MADRTPLAYASDGRPEEFASGDTFPVTRLALGSSVSGQHVSNVSGAAAWAWELMVLGIVGSAIDGNVTETSRTLTRDMFYNVLTVPTGVTLRTGNFRIFANEIIIQGTGKITARGHNGGSLETTNPNYPNNWSVTLAIPRSSFCGVIAAGAGGTNNQTVNGAGYNGNAGGSGSGGSTVLGLGGNGGSGGAGGYGSSGTYTGGTGGTGASIATTLAPRFSRLTLDFSYNFFSAATFAGCHAGAGGGGAGPTQFVGGTSGGCGQPGGILAIYTAKLDISTAQAGCLDASAGLSDASTGGLGASHGGAGGTGGAGGGYVHGFIGQVVGSLTNAVTADGAPGKDGGNGFDSNARGGQGGKGGDGGNIDLLVGRIWRTERGTAAGAMPSAPTNATGTAGSAAGTCRLSL